MTLHLLKRVYLTRLLLSNLKPAGNADLHQERIDQADLLAANEDLQVEKEGLQAESIREAERMTIIVVVQILKDIETIVMKAVTVIMAAEENTEGEVIIPTTSYNLSQSHSLHRQPETELRQPQKISVVIL